MVTFRQLRVFSEVARLLSFTRTAAELHLSPPAVTMQVKELEANLGLILFERSGRGVALTTAGEYMLVYARKMLATIKDADDMVAKLKKLEVGSLSIGMVGNAEYFLPKLLARFRQDHAGVEIRLRSGNRDQLVQMLNRNEVDLAIMGTPPRELATRAEPFAAHPHVFIAPPSHPLTNVGHPPVEMLAGYDLIMREPGSGTRAAMEAFFAERRFEPRVGLEMGSNEAVKQAVIAGLGLSAVSLHTVGTELRAGLLTILNVEGAPVVRSWNVVRHLSKTLSPVAEAFRYFVLEQGEGLLAQEFGSLQPLAGV